MRSSSSPEARATGCALTESPNLTLATPFPIARDPVGTIRKAYDLGAREHLFLAAELAPPERRDALAGELEYKHETVYLMCAIPKERGGHVQPFPVAFYGHGYTSAKPELLGFAGSLGRFGIATCSIDAFGHGLPDSELITGIVKTLLDDVELDQLADVIFLGRSRDLNRDGVTDSGGDFWGANIFHTRDVVR